MTNKRIFHPRPDFRRDDWTDLNGIWEFEFDDLNVGEQDQWYKFHNFTKSILVPFCYQSKLSGIYDKGYHPYVWYRRTFQIKCPVNQTMLLNFGAVDYHAKVWVNHQYVGEHYGGHTPFCFEVSNYMQVGDNEIVVRVEDTDSCEYPRGKQIWNTKPERCWYTATTGIWQTVWLEYTGRSYIERIRITPDIDKRSVHILTNLRGASNSCLVSCKVWRGEEFVASSRQYSSPISTEFEFVINETDFIEEFHYWSPESPNLYDVEFSLHSSDNELLDTVHSYFGMRKIAAVKGQVLLNNKPYYQKMVLDQGYWSDGLLTPPSAESYRQDIEMVKAMGFNGIRKHQKIEAPLFYYWADVLGILVWEEMPSCYVFSEKSMENTLREWTEVLNRDYNHPSVITWVLLNESWGVRNIYASKRQQDYAKALYCFTKAMDTTRLVSINDGWEQLEESDICSIHDYQVTGEDLIEKYSCIEKILQMDAQGRMLYADGHSWKGQPVILSEFGGLAFGSDYENGWGYNGGALSLEEWEKRYRKLVQAIAKMDDIVGFCYTQLEDTMQEINGLLNPEHQPKIDVEIIRKINETI